MNLVRTVTTDRPVDRVFGYLSDFTTTTEWDPGTVRTTRVSGDGGVGTRYHNVSRFAGRQTELSYVVQELLPGKRIRLRGRNRSVTAHDTITCLPIPEGGTRVTYAAVFEFAGMARLAVPFLGPAFRRLGDEAQAGLHAALARL